MLNKMYLYDGAFILTGIYFCQAIEADGHVVSQG